MVTLGQLKQLYRDALSDKKMNTDEAQEILGELGGQTLSAPTETFLEDVLTKDARKLPQVMRDGIRTLLGKKREVISADETSVYIARAGIDTEDTTIRPYERGYLAMAQGPLRQANGSEAPAMPSLSRAELKRVREQTPGAALDAMAKHAGVKGLKRFATLPTTTQFYNAKAEFWEGKCHAWAPLALSPVLNKLVDVPGKAGERGMWYQGQWLSRADLGNWLMGLADNIALANTDRFDSQVTALDLLRASQVDLASGGFFADIHLDKDGKREVWNQPFYRSASFVQRVDAPKLGANVYAVDVRAYYGDEQGDTNEDATRGKASMWRIFAVCDAKGKVSSAYLQDDPKLEGLDLPRSTSHTTLEYICWPDMSKFHDALSGKDNSAIDDDSLGKEFRFFVGNVLQHGVSASERARFEAAVPKGRISAEKAAALAKTFKGVAHAYTAEQWQRSYGRRGLNAEQFHA